MPGSLVSSACPEKSDRLADIDNDVTDCSHIATQMQQARPARLRTAASRAVSIAGTAVVISATPNQQPKQGEVARWLHDHAAGVRLQDRGVRWR